MLFVCLGVAILAAIQLQWVVALAALVIAGFPVALPRLKIFELGGGAGGNLPVLKGEMLPDAPRPAATDLPPPEDQPAPPPLPPGQEPLPRSTESDRG